MEDRRRDDGYHQPLWAGISNMVGGGGRPSARTQQAHQDDYDNYRGPYQNPLPNLRPAIRAPAVAATEQQQYYAVNLITYHQDLPFDHHAIFVETSKEYKSGRIYHVRSMHPIGPLLVNMEFETKETPDPRRSPKYTGQMAIGYVAREHLGVFETICRSNRPPGPGREFSGESLRHCQHWAAETVGMLVEAGVVVPQPRPGGINDQGGNYGLSTATANRPGRVGFADQLDHLGAAMGQMPLASGAAPAPRDNGIHPGSPVQQAARPRVRFGGTTVQYIPPRETAPPVTADHGGYNGHGRSPTAAAAPRPRRDHVGRIAQHAYRGYRDQRFGPELH